MKKIRYSEIFCALQGEGRFVGVPSIFLRTYGCNFQCMGFGQPKGGPYIATDQMPYMTDPRADKNHPEAYKSIEELPVTPIGCDSSASWAMKYKHLQTTKTTHEIAHEILNLLDHESMQTGVKNFVNVYDEDVHLVITGGEPLLGWQRAYPELLSELFEYGLKNVTFETNGTQIVDENFIDFFNNTAVGRKIHVTWSVSPKLMISGEKKEDALKPKSLKSMNEVINSYLYTKFVVRDKDDFDEFEQFVLAYKLHGVKIDSIYAMPEGALTEQQRVVEKEIAEECIRSGFRFSPRLHVSIFGNAWGT